MVSPATDEVSIHASRSDIAVLRDKSSLLGKLRAVELWLDKKLKVEPMGIERIPEDKRRPPSVFNVSDDQAGKRT